MAFQLLSFILCTLLFTSSVLAQLQAESSLFVSAEGYATFSWPPQSYITFPSPGPTPVPEGEPGYTETVIAEPAPVATTLGGWSIVSDPMCYATCFAQVVTSSSCSITDTTCVCTNQALLSGWLFCLSETCTPLDYPKALMQVEYFACSAALVSAAIENGVAPATATPVFASTTGLGSEASTTLINAPGDAAQPPSTLPASTITQTSLSPSSLSDLNPAASHSLPALQVSAISLCLLATMSTVAAFSLFL